MKRILILAVIPSVILLSTAYSEESTDILSEVVTLEDLFPINVTYGSSSQLSISETEVRLKRYKNEELLFEAAMPIDKDSLLKAIEGIPKDYFKGTVSYKRPLVTHPIMVRLSTPLGDISEIAVFWPYPISPLTPELIQERSTTLSSLPESIRGRFDFPQAILRLEPLFALFQEWKLELGNNPNQRLEPIVKTPVDEVEAQSTQAHP